MVTWPDMCHDRGASHMAAMASRSTTIRSSNHGDETMKPLISILAAVMACALLALPRLASAQASTGIPPAITTPDKVETRLGTLDFKDGAPSQATLDKVYDHLDF